MTRRAECAVVAATVEDAAAGGARVGTRGAERWCTPPIDSVRREAVHCACTPNLTPVASTRCRHLPMGSHAISDTLDRPRVADIRSRRMVHPPSERQANKSPPVDYQQLLRPLRRQRGRALGHCCSTQHRWQETTATMAAEGAEEGVAKVARAEAMAGTAATTCCTSTSSGSLPRIGCNYTSPLRCC